MVWLALFGLAHAGSTEIGSSRPFGLGIQLGTFSGITGKYYLTRKRRNAIDFSVGGAYGESLFNSLHAHVTYHQHISTLTKGDGVTIPWRVGIGGWINSGRYLLFDDFDGDGLIIGARVPVGLDFDLEEVPVQFYIEAALNLSVIPGIFAGLDAGVGARYYF